MAKDKKRDAILNAAFNQFSHYSFRKTSMEDIAKAAGISRASIYSYFQNKDDIFRSVSIQWHDHAEQMAQASLANSDASIAERIEGALLARRPLSKIAPNQPMAPKFMTSTIACAVTSSLMPTANFLPCSQVRLKVRYGIRKLT